MAARRSIKCGRTSKANSKGDQVEEDAFVAQTSTGSVPMRNIIAKFPGSKDGINLRLSVFKYWRALGNMTSTVLASAQWLPTE